VWVTIVPVPPFADATTLLEQSEAIVRATAVAPAGSTIVLTAGWSFGRPRTASLLHVLTR
jgi:hypothetical protein